MKFTLFIKRNRKSTFEDEWREVEKVKKILLKLTKKLSLESFFVRIQNLKVGTIRWIKTKESEGTL